MQEKIKVTMHFKNHAELKLNMLQFGTLVCGHAQGDKHSRQSVRHLRHFRYMVKLVSYPLILTILENANVLVTSIFSDLKCNCVPNENLLKTQYMMKGVTVHQVVVIN